jgi:hypothetical protein
MLDYGRVDTMIDQRCFSLLNPYASQLSMLNDIMRSPLEF